MGGDYSQFLDSRENASRNGWIEALNLPGGRSRKRETKFSHELWRLIWATGALNAYERLPKKLEVPFGAMQREAGRKRPPKSADVYGDRE
jgi:hypothetical protein